MSEGAAVLIAVLGFAVVFPAMWTGVVWMVGAMGWRPLAARFPADRWPGPGEGDAASWQTGRVGLANYRSALNAVLTDDGLSLRPVALFAVNHPPLFIPWSAVVDVRAVLFGGVRVEVEGGGTVVLYGRLARLLKDRLGL